MVLEAEQLGLRGLCITEHSGPWERHEFEGFAQQHDLVLIRAMEVDTDMGHMLAFGLGSYLPGMEKAAELRRASDAAGGFVVTAHPFRGLYNSRPLNRPLLYKDGSTLPTTVEEAAAHPVFKLVDAVEAGNGCTEEAENAFALKVASHLGFDCTGGSDAHSRGGLGRCVTVFPDEIHNEEEFLTALRGGHYYSASGLATGHLVPFTSH